jgi:hypothetical protein
MLPTADMPTRRLVLRNFRLITPFFTFALLVSMFALPSAATAVQDSPEADQLKQEAGDAFVKGDYARAASLDLEIAQKYPKSSARAYAVQMLGTIYEDNLVDVQKAINWDREYLEKYANQRQVSFYQDKLATLQKLLDQQDAFKTYQAIRSANDGDEVKAQRYEALLKEHPEFRLKDEVEKELGYTYARLDDRKKSALAFEALASQGENKMPAGRNPDVEKAERYWRMETTWAWVAWGIVAALWIMVLWMKPWSQLTRRSVKKFLLWPVLWLVVSAASLPLFFNMDTGGYSITIPARTIYLVIGLNLIVLLWVLLLVHGRFWQGRPLALRLLSPVLAVMMTVGVFYLFVAYYPNGPYIVDESIAKYGYWRAELKEWKLRRHFQASLAEAKDKRAEDSAKKATESKEGNQEGK